MRNSPASDTSASIVPRLMPAYRTSNAPIHSSTSGAKRDSVPVTATSPVDSRPRRIEASSCSVKTPVQWASVRSSAPAALSASMPEIDSTRNDCDVPWAASSWVTSVVIFRVVVISSTTWRTPSRIAASPNSGATTISTSA